MRGHGLENKRKIEREGNKERISECVEDVIAVCREEYIAKLPAMNILMGMR